MNYNVPEQDPAITSNEFVNFTYNNNNINASFKICKPMAKSKISKFDKFDKLRNNQSWVELKALSKMKVFTLPYNTWAFEVFAINKVASVVNVVMKGFYNSKTNDLPCQAVGFDMMTMGSRV